MPLFGKKAPITNTSGSKKNGKASRLRENEEKDKTARPTASQRTPDSISPPAAEAENEEAEQLAKRLIFHAQLAHGSPTGKIENFSNVKDLYQRIGDAFSIPPSEVQY